MTAKKDTTTNQTPTTPVLKMTLQVLLKVISTIGCQKAETGGILGGKDDVITHYHPDSTGSTSRVTYSPDVEVVNKQLYRWNNSLVRLRSFVHSHPRKNNKPSGGDLVYAKQILNHIDDLECLWLPIVNTIPDTGVFTLTPWVVRLVGDNVELARGQIEIESEESIFELTGELVSLMNLIPCKVAMDSIELNSDDLDWLNEEDIAEETHPTGMFDRVKEAYDLERMSQTLIVAGGTGGSAEWLEHMARCGVEQFYLIDPDTVSVTNMGTQQTYLKDVGRPKVDCIAERIKEINPSAKVLKTQRKLEDIPYEILRELIIEKSAHPRSHQTILCGFTDNFDAQAQVNLIALQLGIPSLCAQLYREGRAAEITFTYPGVTPACHRCMLSPRYKYYLEGGYENDVTSHGTPIFATAILNAIKGYIALAMIHHGSGHKRWGNTLERIENRSLVQIRLDPDISNTLGMPTFDKVFKGANTEQLFFGEPVWIPQEPECPETGYPKHCPDCGGTGDLRDAIGTIKDTKLPVETKNENVATMKGAV